MRHIPGSIELSVARDIPLLRRVFQSEVISHDQLFELSRLEWPATSRNAFNWRVSRLVAHGLLTKDTLPMTKSGWIYSVSRNAFEILAEHEEISSVPTDQFERWSELQQTRRYHALGLNEIHIALRKSKEFLDWVPGTQVQAENDLTRLGYGKDYDAVVFLRKDNESFNFALEYERSRKTVEKYHEIMSAFQTDYRVHQLVYIVAHDHLRTFLRSCFGQARRRILVVLERDFQSRVLHSSAEQMGPSGSRAPLIELLSDHG